MTKLEFCTYLLTSLNKNGITGITFREKTETGKRRRVENSSIYDHLVKFVNSAGKKGSISDKALTKLAGLIGVKVEIQNIYKIGYWILNNDERPTVSGVYRVIDADDKQTLSHFDGRHWLIDISNEEHPVKMWWKD